MPSSSAACAMPSIACASSQPISGFSGLPKLRQSVSASGSPPAQATFSAASITARQPAANGSRSPSGGPSSETAMPRVPSMRSTAASRPGRRTVREPTRWSYCSNTHVFGSSLTGSTGARRDRVRRLLDLVARALVGEQRGRDRADDARRRRTRAARRGRSPRRSPCTAAPSARRPRARRRRARARRPRPSAPATRRS